MDDAAASGARLDLRVLGPVGAVRNGSTVAVGGPRQRAVLALLVLAGGRRLTAENLVRRVWGDEAPASALKTVRAYVSRLRGALGPEVIIVEDGGYRLAVGRATGVVTDVSQFEELAAAGRSALAAASSRPAAAADLLGEALSLWRGTGLAEGAALEDVEGEAARLTELRLTAQAERIEAWLALGRDDAAIAEVERLVVDHPLHERLWGQLMTALYRQGRQADALAAFQRARGALVEQLGLEPGPVLRQLEAQVLQQSVDLGPNVGSRRPPTGDVRSPLPVPRSSFIGRGTALEELSALVATERLVTLTGAGGCGKTRLALRLAIEIEDRFEQGAAFADLAAVTDPKLAADAVGASVEMPAGSRPSHALDDLATYLGGRSLVLVLDNCEHLLDGCAELADVLLSRCPGLRLLATSREPLAVEGERVWRVPSLDAAESQLLFSERARSRGATVDADDEVVAEICRRLDGIPLAIELAAAKVSRLPIAEIPALLDDRFQLLDPAVRRSRPRQRTLEATLDWSYELLRADQQQLLRATSVFVGSFSLAAAAAVCADEGESRAAIAARLGSLVDKSLVLLDSASERYRLLETTRLYANRKLSDAGEAERFRGRLLEWLFDSLPGPWRWTRLVGEDFEAELDNLRGALDWLQSTGRPDVALRLAAWAGPVWFVTTRAAEGLESLSNGRVRDESLPLDDRLAWRVSSAWCHTVTMEGAAALELAGQGIALAPEGHPALVPLLFVQAWMLNFVDSDRALESWDHVRATNAGQDVVWEGTADYFEACGLLAALELERALPGLRAAARADVGIVPGHAHLALAVTLHLLGRQDEAAVTLSAAKAVTAGSGSWYLDLSVPLTELLVALGRDDLASAQRFLGSLVARTRSRYPHMPGAWGFALQGAAALASVVCDHEAALTLLAGSRRHGLHRRYEAALAAGRLYMRRSQAAASPKAAARAREAGEAMSLEELISLAGKVFVPAAGFDADHN